jgi:DNA modification methylase
MQKTAQNLEHIALDALIPYARNSRTHSETQVAQVAASIREFGFTNPVLIDAQGGIIAGHGRVLAARKLGLDAVPAIRIDYMTEAQKRAYIIADNKLALNAGWDDELLALELGELQDEGFDLSLTGFDDDELAALLLDEAEEGSLGDGEEIPEAMPDPVSVTGDVWQLGPHRVMCGDSTIISDVEKLMDGKTAQLLHADPPYGMGKEGDGVANDNLYAADLDRFQMEWWATFRTFIDDNASAYIWGNAPDLWRLWYAGGLGDSEKFELRNEIVWDKKNIAGMASPDLTQYPIATERCLFFQLGNQFLGNVNAADFPESWEPVRGYMESQAKAAGVNPAEIKRVCGCGMYSHWFTKSQFTLIPEKHYRNLANEYPGHFAKPWKELKAEWDRVKGGPNSEVQSARSYFDNAHEPMRDVWEFSRVTGEERYGHATPKPVAMMERVMKSSLRVGGLVVEPFGGSGATLIGAEKSGRVCYTMEMQGRYVDVIVRRWQKFTGKKAILESTGQDFDTLEAERLPAGDE